MLNSFARARSDDGNDAANVAKSLSCCAGHTAIGRADRRPRQVPELLRNDRPLSTHFRYDLNSGHFAALR